MTDVSELPDEWLDAFVDYISDHDELSPDEAFILRVKAAFTIREIERREGRGFCANPAEGLAEYARRHGGEGAEEAWRKHLRGCTACKESARRRRDDGRCAEGQELRDMFMKEAPSGD